MLVADVRRRRSKLHSTLIGPFLVIDTESPFVYKLKHLISGQERPVHYRRMAFYNDGSLGLTAPLRDRIAFQDNEFDVSCFLDVRFNNRKDNWELLTRWHGFDDAEATWEPLRTMCEDVPEVVSRFAENLEDGDDKKNAILAELADAE